MPAALAAVVAGCLLIQPGVDQVVDALPSLQPRFGAPIYALVSAGDLACMILTRNPKGAIELAQHALAAGLALHALGVRIEGRAEIRSGLRGSNKWIQQ